MVFGFARWRRGCFDVRRKQLLESIVPRNLLVFAFCVTAFGAACSDSSEDARDEFAGDEAGHGGGKADDSGLYTYFTVDRDTKKCLGPQCGGYWLKQVNTTES